MKRLGRKGNEWEKVRASLKVRFFAAGITRCEIHGDGCVGGLFLGFAHFKPRRHLNREQLADVVLACQPCHAAADLLKQDARDELFRGVIARRESAV